MTRRSLSLAIVLFVCGFVGSQAILGAQSPNTCTACQPQYLGVSQELDHHICFEPATVNGVLRDFTEDEVNWIIEGIHYYWNLTYLPDLGRNPNFTFDWAWGEGDCGDNDVVFRKGIVQGGATAETLQMSDGSERSVVLQYDWSGHPGYDTGNSYRNMGAHEAGHLLSLADVYTSGCNNYTVMWYQANPNNWSHPAGCSDQAGLTSLYTTYSSDNRDYETPIDDCWDTYLVHYYTCYDAANSTWYECGVTWTYLFSWCY